MFKAWHVWPEPRKAFSGTRPSAKDSPSFGISSNSNLKQCRTANVCPTSLLQFCCVFIQVPENVVLMKVVTSPLCSKETHENLRNNLKRLTSSIISPKGSQKCKKNSVLYYRATKWTQTRSDKCPLQPGLVWYTVSVIANLSFRVTRFALFQSWECSHFFQLHLCCGQPVLSKTSADNLATKKITNTSTALIALMWFMGTCDPFMIFWVDAFVLFSLFGSSCLFPIDLPPSSSVQSSSFFQERREACHSPEALHRCASTFQNFPEMEGKDESKKKLMFCFGDFGATTFH